jgi:hypothetical protein
LPIEGRWSAILRTVLAVIALVVVGALTLILLSSVPAYRDVWLVLLGVLGAGIFGAWRADLDRISREVDWRRDLNLKRLDHTQEFVFIQVFYQYDRSRDLAVGREPPRLPTPPLYTEVGLAGDADALVAWHTIWKELMAAPSVPMSTAQASRLSEAATAISAALQAQRVRLWHREAPRLLTPEEELRVRTAADPRMTG